MAVRCTDVDLAGRHRIDDRRVRVDEELARKEVEYVLAGRGEMHARNEVTGGAVTFDPRDPSAAQIVDRLRPVPTNDEGGMVRGRSAT